MSCKQIFKKVLIPCAAGLTANSHTYGPNCVKKSEDTKKPSELPIYVDKCNVCACSEKKKEPPGAVEEAIGNVRRELWVWQDNMKGYRHKFVDVYKDTFQKVDFVLDYLREESHGPERGGAIVLSGVAGYIWGMRHCSIIRRLFTTTCGALTMAAICYPKEGAEYFEKFIKESKRSILVAYHFIWGDPDVTQIENMSSTQLGRLTIKTLAWNRDNLKRHCNCDLDLTDPKPCSVTHDVKAGLGFGTKQIKHSYRSTPAVFNPETVTVALERNSVVGEVN